MITTRSCVVCFPKDAIGESALVFQRLATDVRRDVDMRLALIINSISRGVLGVSAQTRIPNYYLQHGTGEDSSYSKMHNWYKIREKYGRAS